MAGYHGPYSSVNQCILQIPVRFLDHVDALIVCITSQILLASLTALQNIIKNSKYC